MQKAAARNFQRAVKTSGCQDHPIEKQLSATQRNAEKMHSFFLQMNNYRNKVNGKINKTSSA